MNSSDSKEPPFHAYVSQPQLSSLTALFFASAAVAETWWSIARKRPAQWASNLNASDLSRPGHHWFMVNTRDAPHSWLSKMMNHADMASIYGAWSWKRNPDSDVSGIAFTSVPFVAPAPVGDRTAKDTNTATLATLKMLNASIAKLNSGTTAAGEKGGAGGKDEDEAANWDAGPNWEGGDRSYRIVATAFKMAKELKDRGDTRHFAMIFGQLSMELRRTT